MIGMAGKTPFDSWMERATAEFFEKLSNSKQPAAGSRFVCRVGLEDVFFIEYGDHQSLLQALVSKSFIRVPTPTNGDSSIRWASGPNMVGCF